MTIEERAIEYANNEAISDSAWREAKEGYIKGATEQETITKKLAKECFCKILCPNVCRGGECGFFKDFCKAMEQ